MSGILILLYHRVAEPGADPFGLAVAPDRFRAHVEHLAQLRSVVPLTDIGTRSRARRIAITFDDGYADNAEVAAPLLVEAGLPVTWFITAGRLGGRWFWWDRLTHALLGPHPLPEAVDLTLPTKPVWLDLRTLASRKSALNLIHHRIRPLPPAEVEAMVDDIVTALNAPPPPPDATTMSIAQLQEIARLPDSAVGAHTLTHVQLRGQNVALKREEILGSVEQLGSLLKSPILSFAYPFGSPRAVDRDAQRLVREAGCELACSTDRGIAKPGKRQRFLLPRMAVGDLPLHEFAAVLDEALDRESW